MNQSTFISGLVFLALLCISRQQCLLNNPVQAGYSTSWWTLDTFGNTAVGQKWLTPIYSQATLVKITIPLYSIASGSSAVNAYLVLDDGAGSPSYTHVAEFFPVSVSASADFVAYDFIPYVETILYPNTNYWFIIYPATSSDQFRWATTTSPSIGPGTILEISATLSSGIWFINPNVVSATQIAITTTAPICDVGVSTTCNSLANSPDSFSSAWSISSYVLYIGQQWLTHPFDWAELASVGVILKPSTDASANAYAMIVKDKGGYPDTNQILYVFPNVVVVGGSSFSQYNFAPSTSVGLDPNTYYWFIMAPTTAYDAFTWQSTLETSTGWGSIPLVSAGYIAGSWQVNPSVNASNLIQINTGKCAQASSASTITSTFIRFLSASSVNLF